MTGRPLLLLTLVAALAACSQKAAPFKNPYDRLMSDLGQLFGFAYFPCTYVEVVDGLRVITGPGVEHCYLFDPPERIRGVWMPGLEASEFLPDAASAPKLWTPWDEDRDTTWLQVDWPSIESRLPPPVEVEGEADTAAYLIEFIGRRASYPDRYGHGGLADRLIILDRLISARAIPPPSYPGRQAAREIMLRKFRQDRRREAAEAEARSEAARDRLLPPCPRFLCPSRSASSPPPG